MKGAIGLRFMGLEVHNPHPKGKLLGQVGEPRRRNDL